MSESTGSINGRTHLFRAAALNRYTRGLEQITFPRLACPRALAYLWLLLLLLLVAGAFCWFALESVL